MVFFIASIGQAKHRQRAVRKRIGRQVHRNWGSGNGLMGKGNKYERQCAKHAHRHPPLVPNFAHYRLVRQSAVFIAALFTKSHAAKRIQLATAKLHAKIAIFPQKTPILLAILPDLSGTDTRETSVSNRKTAVQAHSRFADFISPMIYRYFSCLSPSGVSSFQQDNLIHIQPHHTIGKDGQIDCDRETCHRAFQIRDGAKCLDLAARV